MRTPTDSNSVGSARARLAGTPILATCLVLTGCALGKTTTAEDAATTTATTSPPAGATLPATATLTGPPPSNDRILPVGPTWLRLDDDPQLGTIVVDGSERTVYFSTSDTENAPTCYDVCADTWLPLLTDSDPAGGIGIDVEAADVVTRRDGSDQVTYQGHPLYYYAGDTTPGQSTGHGLELFGARWYAMGPDGERADGATQTVAGPG